MKRPFGKLVATVSLVLSLGAAPACHPEMREPPPPNMTPLEVGESRDIELRFLKFDVSNFSKTLRKEDLQALPRETRERMWLLDLDLSGGASSPKLLENAVSAVKKIDPKKLSVPARNLQNLLLMTPDSANLDGTSLEGLLELAPLLGIAPPRVLADLLKIDVSDTFLPTDVVTKAILENVIETHPNARTRLGPKVSDNPTGVYPVQSGSLPCYLEDILTDGAALATRFGVYRRNGEYHPGFISKAVLHALTDDFSMTVRVNANALPYKGVDLGSASPANVNSVPSQVKSLFDYSDPNWLTIQGLVREPALESMTFRWVESPEFVHGGRLPTPAGLGSSSGWQLPPWTLEHIILRASREAYPALDGLLSYGPAGKDPIVTAHLDKSWLTLTSKAELGSPPPPSYLWDALLEIAQVRLHDGGLAEGDADVELSLENIPLGIDSDTLTDTIRSNLMADPSSVVDVATQVIDTSRGNGDFYYYKADPRTNPVDVVGDYLYFIVESDIAVDRTTGEPVRPYAYAQPGFFADEALTNKVSSTRLLDGDTEHEKVRVVPGDVLYTADDEGKTFRIDVGPKTHEDRQRLTITRVK